MSLHRILLFVATALAFTTAHAEVYKYFDSNGNLVLSDTLPKDSESAAKAEKIEARPLMTVPALPGSKRPAAPAAGKKATDPGYTVVIQNPEPGATYQRNAAEMIPVAVSVSPSVLSGHRLLYLVDGNEQDGAIGSLRSDELDRGTHRLEVRVVDAGGETLSSSMVEFNIQQTSALGPSGPKPK